MVYDRQTYIETERERLMCKYKFLPHFIVKRIVNKLLGIK